MIRIAAITTLLSALIGNDAHQHGAEMALIMCDRSADLHGYACKASTAHEPRPRAGLMAPATRSPPSAEERARTLAAIAITAWRKNARPSHKLSSIPAPAPASTSASLTASRHARMSRRRDPSSHSSHSTRERRLVSPDRMPSPVLPRARARRSLRDEGTASASEDQSASGAETESDVLDTHPPLFVECELGRILVVRIHVHAISEQYERHKLNRLRGLQPPSRFASRHTSFTNSTSTASGLDVSTRTLAASLRAHADENTDTGLSTEDETDMDSSSWAEGLKSNVCADSLLLVLHAPRHGDSAVSWDTLVRQAEMYADVSANANRPTHA